MTKPKEHPKLLNEFMLYEGLNEINSVFGILIAFRAYIKGDTYHKYHAEMILDSIQELLGSGTQIIEEWMQIEDVEEENINIDIDGGLSATNEQENENVES
jgi:hypothetical protein